MVLHCYWKPQSWARIYKTFKEPKNRFPARPARLHGMAESIPRYRFLYKYGLWMLGIFYFRIRVTITWSTGWQAFICLRPPPLLGFWLFVCGGGLAILKVLNLVRYSMLNCCRIWSPTGLNTPTPSQPHNVCTLTLGRERGGESWTREKVRGATVPKAGSKIPKWLTVSLVYQLW